MDWFKYDGSQSDVFMGIIILLLSIRLYHMETIDSMQSSHHTHVRVTGQVTYIRKESDGDIHFTLSDNGRFIVCEIVPWHPLVVPKLKSNVIVYGIRRIDNEAGHNWVEIHPVEKWVLIK